jgi:hypothetical protein
LLPTKEAALAEPAPATEAPEMAAAMIAILILMAMVRVPSYSTLYLPLAV